MYDVTSWESLNAITDWKLEVDKNVEEYQSLLVGNKTDLIDERVVSTEEGQNMATKLGMNYIDARTVHEKGSDWVTDQIKEIVGDHAAYVSFDIDALDPAFAPGTGTPVWGGLATWQAAAILRDMAGMNIVGGDVVEVSPPYDTTGATAVAGAHVAMELCCLALWNKRGR